MIQERARSVIPRDEIVCFLFFAVSKSLVTLVVAVSVEWWGQKPDCSL